MTALTEQEEMKIAEETMAMIQGYQALQQQALAAPQREPDETDVLTLDQIKAYSQVLVDLRKKRHKAPFSHRFNEALERLGAHYTVKTKQYLEMIGDDREWVKSYIPTDLPPAWQILSRSKHGLSAQHRDGLTVMMSGVIELDGQRWLHLSCSRESRLPNWEDVVKVKETFIGQDTEGIIKLAPRSQWVNLMPFCLHVWSCVDGDVTPDFTHGTGTI